MTDTLSKINFRKVSITKNNETKKNTVSKNRNKEILIEKSFNKIIRPNNIKNNNYCSNIILTETNKNNKIKKLEVSVDISQNFKKLDISNLYGLTSKNKNSSAKSPGKITLLKFKSPSKLIDETIKDSKSKISDITITNIKYFGIDNHKNPNVNKKRQINHQDERITRYNSKPNKSIIYLGDNNNKTVNNEENGNNFNQKKNPHNIVLNENSEDKNINKNEIKSKNILIFKKILNF
jgi:hypothetical protein